MDHLLQDFTPSSSTLRSLPWSSHTFLWAPPSPPTLSPCAAFMSLCYCLSPSGWQAFVVRVQALFLSTTNKTPLDLSSDSLISQKTSNHPPLLCPLRLATMLFSTRSGPDRVLTMEYAITNLISTPAWWDRDYSVPIVQMRTLRLREKRKQTQGTQLISSIVKVYSLVVSLQRLPWSRCPSPYLPSVLSPAPTELTSTQGLLSTLSSASTCSLCTFPFLPGMPLCLPDWSPICPSWVRTPSLMSGRYSCLTWHLEYIRVSWPAFLTISLETPWGRGTVFPVSCLCWILVPNTVSGP